MPQMGRCVDGCSRLTFYPGRCDEHDKPWLRVPLTNHEHDFMKAVLKDAEGRFPRTRPGNKAKWDYFGEQCYQIHRRSAARID